MTPGRTPATAAILLALVVLAGCREPASTREPVWFTETADAAGLDFVHASGAEGRYWFPETVSSGVCLLDYDGDGRLDIYFVQGGPLAQQGAATGPEVAERLTGDRLFHNQGGLRFSDRTAASGLGDTSYGMGCATGDFDADGWVDLYVTNLGRNTLYRNLGGTFADVTAGSGAGVEAWSSSAGFGDFDGDGHLDLFVVDYIEWTPDREIECHERGHREYCSPNNYRSPARDRLLLGDGRGRFEDVSEAWGLGTSFGNGLGLRLGDFDLDGDLDAYVANDAMPNQLWINDGHGAFEDRALVLGAAVNSAGMAEAGMGVAAGDIDGDGDEDLLISHLDEETNTLYLNTGGVFEDMTARSGLGPTSRGRTGFGAGFADFDNDGLLDLFVANGRVKHGADAGAGGDPYAEPDLLLRGAGDGRFVAIPDAGLDHELRATSRGAAFGDLDDDGAVDIVVSNRDGPPHLLHNQIGRPGGWVMFRVLDGPADVLGARVEIEAGGRRQWRTVTTTGSYCSANDPRVHFGIGRATTVDRVTVHWLDGQVEDFGPLAPGRLHRLERGR